MLKCSHILFKVVDIKSTVEKLTDIGFNMSWGSAPGKAHNAILWFNEGPFVEFFQMPKYAHTMQFPLTLFKGNSAGKRWLKWINSAQGWCDIALEPIDEKRAFDMLGIRKKLASKGIKNSKIINGKRVRPDGEKVNYNFMATYPDSLPFIVSQYDPPQRPKSIIHPNGILGVADVFLALSCKDHEKYQILCNNDPWIKIHTSNSNSTVTKVNFKKQNEEANIQLSNEMLLHQTT